MSYLHMTFAPYGIGETVRVTGAYDCNGKQGTVTRTMPPHAYSGVGTLYYVTLDGEHEEYPEGFGYWDLDTAGEENDEQS